MTEDTGTEVYFYTFCIIHKNIFLARARSLSLSLSSSLSLYKWSFWKKKNVDVADSECFGCGGGDGPVVYAVSLSL